MAVVTVWLQLLLSLFPPVVVIWLPTATVVMWMLIPLL